MTVGGGLGILETEGATEVFIFELTLEDDLFSCLILAGFPSPPKDP